MSGTTSASRDSYNVLVMSELNGAKKYMYEEGLIGLAHYLKNLPEPEKPNMFVIGGGLLPEIPGKGGPRNRDKLRVLREGVANFDDAAAVMKPHMERIFAELPDTSEIVYVMGPADQSNIDEINRQVSLDYLDAARAMQNSLKKDENACAALTRDINPALMPRIDEVEREIQSWDLLLKDMEQSKELLKRELETAEARKRGALNAELSKLRQNIKRHKEERTEFEERRVLLHALNSMVLSSVPAEAINWLIDDTNEKKKELRAEMNPVMKALKENPNDAESKRSYERMLKEDKEIANSLRALEKRLAEKNQGDSAMERLAQSARIWKFTGNVPVPKSAADMIDQIARSYYMSDLRDAMGRKRDVSIQDSALKVYSKSAGNFGFNVVVTDGLILGNGVYTKGSNGTFPQILHRFLENGGYYEGLERSPLNIAIGSRNGITSFGMEPLKDTSASTMAILAKGSFEDSEASTRYRLEHVRTPESDKTRKMVLDTSVSMLQVGSDGSLMHKLIKKPALRAAREQSDIEEAGALQALIEKVRNSNGDDQEVKEGQNPNLRAAILRSKRPSEIRKDDIAYATEELLLSLIEKVDPKVQTLSKKLGIALFTDIHIGNYGDLALLDSAVKDAVKRKPDILVLDGDNIEGNLGNFKNNPRPVSDVENIEGFERSLRASGMPEGRVNEELVKYLKEQRFSRLENIDSQAKVFLDKMMDLVLDVVKRGGSVVIVSGNHYNGTYRDGQLDEATRLKGDVLLFLAGYEKAGGTLPAGWRDNIKAGPGGKMGAGRFYIEEVAMDAHHAIAANPSTVAGMVERKKTDPGIMVTGHNHKIIETVNNHTMVVQGPGMQMQSGDPFGRHISVPQTSEDQLNGYLYMNVKLTGREVAESTFEPRLKQQLNPDESTFSKYMRDKSSIAVRPQLKRVA